MEESETGRNRFSPAPHAGRLFRQLLDVSARLLFPPSCPACGRHTATRAALCEICWRDVTFVRPPVCDVLGTPFLHDEGEGAISPAAIASPPAFDRARTACLYKGVARKLVHELKYRDRTELAPMMAEWMRMAGKDLLAENPLVVAIPLHLMRRLGRRYNQSGELAREIARTAGLEFSAGLLIRSRNTARQTGLDRNGRNANVRGAFRVREAERSRLAGSTVLLVDDVMTTGATLSAAARALKKAGAARVSVLTFAMTPPDNI